MTWWAIFQAAWIPMKSDPGSPTFAIPSLGREGNARFKKGKKRDPLLEKFSIKRSKVLKFETIFYEHVEENYDP